MNRGQLISSSLLTILRKSKGKKTQTQKEAIQYTLLFKLASPGTVSVHNRGTLKRDTQHTQRQQKTPGGIGVVRKAKQKQKEEGRFGDSRQEKEAATQLNYLRYR